MTTVVNDDDRFLSDPLLSAFLEQDDYFALGLVVNWPADVSAATRTSYNESNYAQFLSTIETECFGGKGGFLFKLPFHALHITIASLFPAHQLRKESNLPDGLSRTRVASFWKKILMRAFQHPDWPKRPLELELEKAEIRNRAGIFLWKEHTGGLDCMRRCLEQAATELGSVLQHLRIPNIIHTTFLRYHKVPDDSLLLRPSHANYILAERVIPHEALFQGANSCSQSNTVVIASVANLVDCKIYLLERQDHEIFLSLPLQQQQDD